MDKEKLIKKKRRDLVRNIAYEKGKIGIYVIDKNLQ